MMLTPAPIVSVAGMCGITEVAGVLVATEYEQIGPPEGPEEALEAFGATALRC